MHVACSLEAPKPILISHIATLLIRSQAPLLDQRLQYVLCSRPTTLVDRNNIALLELLKPPRRRSQVFAPLPCRSGPFMYSRSSESLLFKALRENEEATHEELGREVRAHSSRSARMLSMLYRMLHHHSKALPPCLHITFLACSQRKAPCCIA